MTAPASRIGTQLGPYQIQSLLGSGGMATVYRGLDTNLQRSVAIKVLSDALANDADYVRRFKREAQLIANLRHPNVAQVYAFGEQDGAPYMVQELLPGPTLEARLEELAAAGQLLPPDQVLAVVRQLAAALDAAHAVGVIHRDVKPSNAIANTQGELVLTDFGIARSTADTHLTQPGVVMGTPAYVAPEQAISSAALTPAADVYALGIMLFQLLTGRLPFEADTPTAVVVKHLYEQAPAPSRLRLDLPPGVDAVVARALEKEPADRFQRAGDLATALAQAWAAPANPAAGAAIHSMPTTAWTPPQTAARTANQGPTQVWQPGTPTQALPQNAAPPSPVASPGTALPQQPSGQRRGSLLPWLSLALVLLVMAGALAAWLGSNAGTADSVAASTPSPETAVNAAAPSAPTTEAPTVAPTEAPAAAPTEAPTVAPSATSAPVVSDPLDALGSLISAGLADGSAGDDAQEYIQRYGYLVEAIENGDDKRANEEIRELSRKIEERDRERKLDATFAAQAKELLLAVADRYDLKQPSEGGNNDDD